MGKNSIKLIANNKKAYHDYFIEDTYEAGIALHGTEVKSVRMGKCSVKESFIRIENGEVIAYGLHISPYEKGNIFNRDPMRPKKLLLHRYEINKISGKIAEKGYLSAAEGLYQGGPDQGGDRSRQREKALRQTAGYCEEGSAPGGRAGL